MEVLRVIGVLEPGGAQLSCLRLAEAQKSLGVATRLVAGDATPPGIALAQQYGFDVEAFKIRDRIDVSPRQWTPDGRFAGWLASRVGSADLIHGHMFGAWWAATVAAPHGVPVVASEHNSLTWPLGDHRLAAAVAEARVGTFFAHGPEAWSFFAGLGVRPGRLREGRSAIVSDCTPRPGLVSPRITFTGRLRQDKGPDLLVRAIALLRDPPTAYVLGDGPMRREVQELVTRLGADGVRLIGWSRHPGRYVAGSAVHVVPSREEAWSQSAVTAMAHGVPVVATNVDGLPVTLAHSRGLLVDPSPEALARGIRSVLEGTAELDQEAALAYARRFSPADIAADYLATYRSLLDRGSVTGHDPVLTPSDSPASIGS
ncbi:MAG TPA: glycosyltransferase family 4 protein [Actinomycetes bacterium]|jgi:glycosyltransferase involved in cell wall biosynthesis|nr:glycosyltransferase family 4 protein [Actinomycetes bacterium]